MAVQVGGRYCTYKRIGGGSFGEVYVGEHISSGEEVAIKMESGNSRPAQLFNESKMLRCLAGGVGIPIFKWFGVEADCRILVTEFLGKSLETLFAECHRKFSLKTVLMIADQLFRRIEFIHRRGILHRDIKPDNFVIGRGAKANVIYTIDFGLSKPYLDAKTKQHIPFAQGRPLVGTMQFTSINTHLGIEQSRRDDLESLGYLFVYLLRGSLPWAGLKAQPRHERSQMFGEEKMTTSIEGLCGGLPHEFGDFLREIRKLNFSDEPNYSNYRDMFRALFIREGFVYDALFDWVGPAHCRDSAPAGRMKLVQPMRRIACTPGIPAKIVQRAFKPRVA
jgi:serine/threonine protein kinase